MPKVLFPNDDGYKWQGKANESVFGSGFSVPSGIEATIQYNGVVFNDKSVFDKYVVTSIDGLDDPEVRDVREAKPQDDGEDAFGSLYSGRSIVLNIRVEAYQLKKLRDMEEALRTAFLDLKEKPMYFLTGNPLADHYIMVKKAAKNQKQEDIGQYQGRFFRDWAISLKASDPRFLRNRKKFVGSSFEDSKNINLVNEGNFSALPIIKVAGGVQKFEIVNYDAPYPFNSIKLKDDVIIGTNDFYVFDIKNRTIKNHLGQNKLDDLHEDSGWLRLVSGSNKITLSNETILSGDYAQVTIEYRDSWL